jgi:2-succinyl-5-enolpyruvyl-6-hydroxy-3-cyclohexene-1-carboxylate synthase
MTEASGADMPVDFRNTNLVWASVLVETLARLGLTTAIVCPGSRSAPLAIAFAQSERIQAIPVLDERSASFLALGIARQCHQPVALICTSGTAAANFYPAVIEARESGVPLLVLTADRPPELRHCHAGQTIDQQKLYGCFPHWSAELSMPAPELALLAYLRQTVISAWEQTQYPQPGPVHLNVPFREPLTPLTDAYPEVLESLRSHWQAADFFAGVDSKLAQLPLPGRHPDPRLALSALIQEWRDCTHGLIIAGVAQPQSPELYCRAIAHLSKSLGWPVFAEGLSPVRNYAHLNPYLISTYDLILRHPPLAYQLTPKQVIRVGEMPTSKELRQWLEASPAKQWIIAASGGNLDPLHGQTTHLRLAITELAEILESEAPPQSAYLHQWCHADAQVRQFLDQTLSEMELLFEGKAAWLLSQTLPPGTPLFIASSMPVRDVECFWVPNHRGIQPFFNRGANGIDGSLSTALGIAYRQQSSVMLTGDLALLHDTNGFLIPKHWTGHLTIVLINNNGGGIFEMLPIAQFDPPFEEFFATPQHIDFARLCTTYAVEYELIQSWQQLQQRLNPLPSNGVRVLELRTDRRADARWRQENLSKFAAQVSLEEAILKSS